ncbi:MAG: CDP-alcohol phosphatidyltransferase family protein [Spirochaetota bacterium]|jgi:hypothetical protein|nr:CDP-alcohol phosphatidyltransferase family protein [Spirochaetota bacterium]
MTQQDTLREAIDRIHRAGDESINTLLNRPLADLCVAFFYRYTSISANQVTMLAMFTGILSAVAVLYGTPTSLFITGLLFQASAVFDCADGQLARLKGTTSKFGRILDGISDYVVGFANVGATIYACTVHYETVSAYAIIPFSENSALPLILLGFGSLVLHILSFDHLKTRISGIVNTGIDQIAKDRMRLARHSDGKRQSRHRRHPAVIYINRFYTGLQEILLPLGAYTKIHYTERERIAIARQEERLVFLWSFLGPNTHIILSIIGVLCRDLTSVYWVFIIPFNLYYICLLIYTKWHMKKSKEIISS